MLLIANNIDEKNLALQKLIASVNRSTHIVQQLLTMSKLVPEASNINDIDDVNLVKITREVLAMLAPSAVEKQIELEFEHDENPPSLAGNPTALSILIRNLVDNAIRYSKENGKVSVRVYAKKQELILEVCDNGPGIPNELQISVFERFFRVLAIKVLVVDLGLAIVQQFLIFMVAELNFISPTEGTGLIVRVYFPIASES